MAVVVVTKKIYFFLLCLTSLISASAFAAVLPEDRTDIMFHSYTGGGATINGPSILVRKSVGESFSFSANYYVDMVTSATIDVEVLGASEYEEERTEYSLGMDYLYDRTLMNIGYSSSSENDYEAETVSFGISQDFFGDLTNISFGFSKGSDDVYQNLREAAADIDPADPLFALLDGQRLYKGPAEHRRYRLGISQILTRSLILSMNFESVIDEGYLQNPYRATRYVDTTSSAGFAFQEENYPNTRNSDAFSIKALYYLPYRASVKGEFRSFSDSWGITAKMFELRYIHPLESLGLTLEGKIRTSDQTEASFFSDMFPYRNPTDGNELIEFRGRDKELSAYSDITIGLGVSYELKADWLSFFDKSTLNFYWDHMEFDYDTFLDARNPGGAFTPGFEPTYTLSADVLRIYWSFWY